MSQSNDLHEAFRSLAKLAIELALAMPSENANHRVCDALDDVIGWRALLAQDRATRRQELGACASSGEAARTAVEATKRRYEAWHMQSLGDCMCYHCQVQRYGGTIYPITDSLSCPKLKRAEPPLEADDSRVTDGHKCCGGKPDCGCGG